MGENNRPPKSVKAHQSVLNYFEKLLTLIIIFVNKLLATEF